MSTRAVHAVEHAGAVRADGRGAAAEPPGGRRPPPTEGGSPESTEVQRRTAAGANGEQGAGSQELGAPGAAPAAGGRPRNRLPPLEGAASERPRAGWAPGEVLVVPIEAIDPNPHQPRRSFPEERIEELSRSLRRHGMLQPLTVRRGPAVGRWQLICGERRLRAAARAGLAAVPCIVAEVPDGRIRELALVENLQREDLDPIEAAEAYRALMAEHGYTQDDLAKKLALARPTIANALRLLDLPETLRVEVAKGALSSGHARAIAAVEGEPAQRALAARVVAEGMTVRETEAAAARAKHRARAGAGARKLGARPAYLDQIEDRLRRQLGTKVVIEETGPHRGRISIDFYGDDDFERLLERLS